ncbi:MAG TPA: DUF4139 domain-containing protein [Candidatus Eisenbacteria bacterium]
MRNLLLIAWIALSGATAAAAPGDATRSGAAPAPLRSSGPPDLVLYNDDRALVREPRVVRLARGTNEVILEGVPARLDSASVELSGPGLTVRRQSFRYDLWSADRVFRRFLGDSIAYRYANRPYRGVLAGIDGDDLFITRRDSVGVLTMVKRQQISDVEFPAGHALATRPALLWTVESAATGEAKATLSYLTAGIGWSAEYAARLAADERSVDLSGWASLANRSGASYESARVELVAGEMHRAGETPDRGPAALEAGPHSREAAPAGLFAYHVYPLGSRIDLRHLETIQVPLFPPARVPVRRVYVYDGARDGSKVGVRVEFGNEKAPGLGIPLPAGRVRIYADDPAGAPTLVGEDAIGHTAAGEKIAILSGVAYDLVGARTRVAHSRVSRNVTEDRFEIRLRNRGRTAAVVMVTENLYGNWDITARSAPYRTKDAQTVEFDLEVPAGDESKLGYTVRYTY